MADPSHVESQHGGYSFMKRLIPLMLAAAVCTSIQSAPADTTTIEMKAYSTPDNQVLLLPATQASTMTSLKVLNNGAVVTPGASLTLPDNNTFVLKEDVRPGMLLNTTGEVVGTDAAFEGRRKIKIKTPEGKVVIKNY